MKMIKAIAAAAVSAITMNAYAAPALCSVDLKPGVTKVSVKLYEVIDVCLPAGQKIVDFGNGYADGWLVASNKESGRMMLKQNGAGGGGIETNIIIWSDTNDRYELKLSQSFSAEVKAAGK